MNKMRYIHYILQSIVCAVFLVSCTGQVDDTALPVLTVDDTEVDIAEDESVAFTVTYNGEDVTSASRIYAHDGSFDLDGNVFTPQHAGDYTFVAEYLGAVSLPVEVSVVDMTPEVVESRYDRHVFVAEFTGAWCINCPGGYSNMHLVLSQPVLKDYKANIHLAAFHSDVEGTDTLAVAATQDLMKMFKGLAYPSYTTDLRDSGLLTRDDNGIVTFLPSLQASFNDYPAHCGVAVSSSLNNAGTSADVTVKVTSEMTSEYRVVVLVLQDRIEGYQKTNDYPDGDDGYIHNHVVRKVVTAYEKTFTGEKLTEDGMISSGDEASKVWTVTVDSGWNLENTYIYALVLDKDGYVNNMNLCPIDGGDSGYDLK